MEKKIISLFMSLSFIFLLGHVASGRGTYLIHMDKSFKPAPFDTHHSWHASLISSLSAADAVAASHLYTYNHVMDGFSAVLSPAQLEKLETMPGFLASYPDTYAQLLTTHSSQFLGLNHQTGLWPSSNSGDDMIIGIIDSGVWPESEMFNDKGMPPVPSRWLGACESGPAFNSSHCNRKLIGARSFSKGLKAHGVDTSNISYFDSPRDFLGHGSHVASTAAGSPTPGAGYFGYAKGTAVGVAPMARIAMYKVIFSLDTALSSTTDILAGMDQAIADGVDLISVSLGLPTDREIPYNENVIALGAFAAMEKGIFVSCACGNSGPDAYTVFNTAPWITTVGAGTIDRDYRALITLGDGAATTIQGKSMYPENIYISGVPLYYGHGNPSKENCSILDAKEVSGKIVLCSFGNVSSQMKEANSANLRGAIIVTDSDKFLTPVRFSIPLVFVSIKQGEIIKKYIAKMSKKTSPQPTVHIKFKLTVLGSKPAPMVGAFSSRGPSFRSPGILKPDIIAPGVNIMAAWVPSQPYQPIGDGDYLLSKYVMASGTSTASPHVVGVAALLRSVHPDWSPAALRSALMTTAFVTDNTQGPILDIETGAAATPLAFGAGHIDPTRAMDPGLVYDNEYQDYVNFLCGLNYSSKQIKIITRNSNYLCTKASTDLNYPSLTVVLNNSTRSASVVFNRVLTNVGDSPSVYHAAVKAPKGMRVVVEPTKLKFSGRYTKQTFSVTVQIDMAAVASTNEHIGPFGYLFWYEKGGNHVVRSPIVSVFGA
ncbi:hypothetical protein ACLOJK_001189 [Asimina triloba]